MMVWIVPEASVEVNAGTDSIGRVPVPVRVGCLRGEKVPFAGEVVK